MMQKVTKAVAPKSSRLNPDHFESVQALESKRGTKKLKTEEFLNKFVYEQRIRQDISNAML